MVAASVTAGGGRQAIYFGDSMKIVMTGASGLVGTALTRALSRESHAVYRLVRAESAKRGESQPGVVDVPWEPRGGVVEGKAGLGGEELLRSGVDAVINLAGASVAEGRWTAERKALLRSSRIDTTRALVGTMARMSKPPRVMISASAVGFYGDRGDEVLTESSAAGTGFLAELAELWEGEALKAKEFGVRVVLLRLGIVLAKNGGALPKMMAPFKFGLGGKLGTGRQWMSWIALEDVVAIIKRGLAEESIAGAVNVVAPEPVRNAEFTRALGQVMHRPAIFSAPAFALRLALAEMADGALLASERVVPEKLNGLGFPFLQPRLKDALEEILRL